MDKPYVVAYACKHTRNYDSWRYIVMQIYICAGIVDWYLT